MDTIHADNTEFSVPSVKPVLSLSKYPCPMFLGIFGV